MRFRIRPPVHPISILNSRIKATHKNVPDIPGSIAKSIQRKLCQGFRFACSKDNQRYGCGMLRKNRKVYAAAFHRRSQRECPAPRDLKIDADNFEKSLLVCSHWVELRPHMSRAYSATVRSLENFPDRDTLRIALRPHSAVCKKF